MDNPDYEFMDKINELINTKRKEHNEKFISGFLKENFVLESSDSNIYYTVSPKKILSLGKYLFQRGKEIFVKNFCENNVYSLKVDGYNVLTAVKVPEEIFEIISRVQETRAFKAVLEPKYYLINWYRQLYNPINIGDLHIQKDISFLDKKVYVQFGPEHDLKEFPEIITSGVYVGYYAMKYFNQDYEGPIEIISSHLPETLLEIKKKKNYSVETIETPIFQDLFLTRTFVKNGKKLIAIIYNSAEYELIPFIPKKIKIATWPVVLRFLLIKNLLNTFDKKKNYEKHFESLLNEKIHINEFIPKPDNYYGVFYKSALLYEKKCEKSYDYIPTLKTW